MRTLTLCSCFTAVISAFAQDNRLPQEEAVRYAKACVSQANLNDAQIQMIVDPEKACAERGEGGGAMIVPDKNLTAQALLKVDKNIVPVGQLWLRKWTLAENNKAVANNRLRVLTLNIDDKDRPMPLCLLGIRKHQGALQLLVYGKDSEPLQILPLKKVDFEQPQPVLLEWQRGEKSIDTLMVRIVGKVETALQVTRQ